jgi:hypothetical protein
MRFYRYFVSQSSDFAAMTLCVASQRVLLLLLLLLFSWSTQSGNFSIHSRNSSSQTDDVNISALFFSPLRKMALYHMGKNPFVRYNILLAWVTLSVNEIIRDDQCGFQSNRSSAVWIFCSYLILEKNWKITNQRISYLHILRKYAIRFRQK